MIESKVRNVKISLTREGCGSLESRTKERLEEEASHKIPEVAELAVAEVTVPSNGQLRLAGLADEQLSLPVSIFCIPNFCFPLRDAALGQTMT